MSKYSDSHKDRGNDYDENFIKYHGRRIIWNYEKKYLSECMRHIEPDRVLDFATGTGRIATEIKKINPLTEVYGIDISKSMLDIAISKNNNIKYIQLDCKDLDAFFEPASFDLVTAFRFFPNADHELRYIASKQLTLLIKPGGYLLFNNHKNASSPSFFLRRAKANLDTGVWNSELLSLFLNNFKIVGTRSYGLWPQTDRLPLFVPWSIVEPIENLNANYFSRLHRLGFDTLFLMRKL